ncbi:MAG TPA: hypothetical protein VHW23_08160 [Kofleriaceae bacterium]|nr:hypothetical protein [Kofleriaceae bacterium]
MTTGTLLLVIAGALGAAACSPPGSAATPKEAMTTPSLAIDVSVTGDGTPALAVRCTAKNVSGQPLHVFDSPRMPYLLDEQGALVVLHGVSPPPEDRDLNVIEIPTTRVLPPGDALTFDVPLVPLRLHNHYGDAPPAARHGAATIVCRVGYGATPIDAAARAHTSITALLAWQQLASSRPAAVQLP